MKERQILFSDAMVLAILEGRKTQTRRIVKNVLNNNRVQMKRGQIHVLDPRLPRHYGQPSDRLWVRECFDRIDAQDPPYGVLGYDYRASHGPDTHQWRMMDELGQRRWKPSIHMPREACRIELEIGNVRVERLQDISAADAIAEGFKALSKDEGRTIKYGIPDRDGLPGTDNVGWEWQDWHVDPRQAYRRLWEQINGAGSWSANPWVWVIGFSRWAA